MTQVSKNINMKKNNEYGSAPKGFAEAIDLSERLDDFLPLPDKLVRRT